MTASLASPGAASGRGRTRSAVLLWALIALMLLLAGETVRRTMSHRYAERDPALALAWDSSDIGAREALANQRLALAMSRAPAPARATALHDSQVAARRALLEGPLHWSVLRDLGIGADVQGDHRRATAIMSRAALRGRRDVAVQGWWLQQALTAGDAAGAVDRIDAMLRSDPTLEPALFPVIAPLAAVEAARGKWVQTLATRPPWRDRVVTDLAANGPDIASVAALFARMKSQGSPPTDAQVGLLVTRMAMTGRYADTRALWLQFAPPAAAASGATLYDGGFRGLAGAPPFNWRIVQPAGGVAGMERRPGVTTALAASYPSSTTGVLAEQLMTLPPGQYRLTGRWRVEQAAPGAAVAWVLTCAGSNTPIAEWRQGTEVQLGWAPIDLPFVAPPSCAAQWLRLVARPGEGFGDVGVAFGELAITPVKQAG